MTANLMASKKLKDCQKDCYLVHCLGTLRALKKVEMMGTLMAWTKVVRKVCCLVEMREILTAAEIRSDVHFEHCCE